MGEKAGMRGQWLTRGRSESQTRKFILATAIELEYSVLREKWACSDLNRGPSDYESPALTAELQARTPFILEHAKLGASYFEEAEA